ncbi:hypothetical protein RGU70_06350 [Herbaspirillum sp. RTI4]|uniref:hypothetical protein n=1 Tax=Herbaspirillum sp. RTI4 TaxID=3048640 RepID=UPI002AB378D8|nr:hypothetical protein [Herbaspirillum sp. RTI4]MDY7577934.1 hypothetical protein [Herbaspirillum sp. RTI4]MEA9981620.1 hypothetical protein [Herbaspirillum sp. RTI4]
MNDPVEKQNADALPDSTAQKKEGDGTPKFGRLLIVLVSAVMLIGVLTYVMESIYE